MPSLIRKILHSKLFLLHYYVSEMFILYSYFSIMSKCRRFVGRCMTHRANLGKES